MMTQKQMEDLVMDAFETANHIKRMIHDDKNVRKITGVNSWFDEHIGHCFDVYYDYPDENSDEADDKSLGVIHSDKYIIVADEFLLNGNKDVFNTERYKNIGSVMAVIDSFYKRYAAFITNYQ